MKWFPDSCRPGDVLRIPVGSFYHYGIYVSDAEVIQFGDAPLDGFSRDESLIRVQAVDIDAFSHGIIPEVGHPEGNEKKKRFPPEQIVARARAAVGEGGYSLLHNNCEHFVNRCVFGVDKCEATDRVRSRWASLFGEKKK